jgi:uncharacterized protein YacL
MESQVWEGNCTVSVIATAVKNCSVNQKQAHKEMAAMYNFRKRICCGSCCLILRLKIITLLQMRRVQNISRLPYWRISIFQVFNMLYFFPTAADKYSKYLLFFQNEQQKNSNLELSNSLIILQTLSFLKFYS